MSSSSYDPEPSQHEEANIILVMHDVIATGVSALKKVELLPH
ncbi:hypothetical protein ACFVHQ_09775 [Actinomycetes bacterium NPDC127524]|nr:MULTISPECIES: hypothetical protein [unclassified Bacillus (in: firmicutes)]